MLRFKLLKFKYRNRPYMEYYAAGMKTFTATDPKEAIGGRWEEMGNHQFEYLVEKGLRPESTLLDYGCGSLRGGLHYINYLEERNYFGVDISPEILEAGKKFLQEEELEYKNPTLKMVNDLNFEDFEGKTFDFILAQSVLTHMPQNNIEMCLKNVRKVMDKDTIFFATFFMDDKVLATRNYMTFHFPLQLMQDIGDEYGHEVTLMEDYNHPRGQSMLKIVQR